MSDANQGQESQNEQLPEHAADTLRKVLAWAIVLLIAVLFGAGGWLGFYSAAPSSLDHETTVLIPRGDGVKNIATILDAQGLIKEDIRFLILARITKTAGRLRSGEFLIPPHQTPMQILQLLEKGDVIHHQVTIPEGLNIEQIAKILQEKGWVDYEKFLELAKDGELIRLLGIDQPDLEGYLFPDTYLLTRGDTTEKSIIIMMVNRFNTIWKSITADNKPAMTRQQILTLASIIEKETGAAKERPLIARVFLNRLQKKMRLQSDPTVIYGLEDFNGNLTRANLQQETAYNTYVINGLPPGPICNPGRASIESVLNPANVDFLYFVSRNDGTHFFSTNLREHNKAVRRFQKTR